MNPPAGASAPTGMGPITVGALLGGRYRVTARLGAGGMATIYRATDESLQRDVAIKVLHPHLADDPSLLQRFRAEARTAAGLLHPNIVNVFDQGTADLPFIVMEYVDGPSLREVLLARGRLSPGEVLAIAQPVCRALARAHDAGLIHRDIKPENVLIAADGTPKVADFGIARALAETSHTATGMLVGSVHYLAPELMGGAEATAASDQYSFAVVVFELLTGRKPLPAETPMAVAMRHARERIPSVRDFVSDAPAALDGVIARATASKPDKRYPDMAAFAAALNHAVPDGPKPIVVEGIPGHAGESTLIIPIEAETTVTVARPARARHARRPAALLLAVLALLAAGGFSLWNWVVAPVRDVPLVVELTEAEAAAALDEQGLTLEVTGSEPDPRVPEGRILTQDPGDEAAARRGGVVAVTLSEGPAEVELPGVVGKAARDVTTRLESAPFFLTVITVREFSDTVPQGRVIAQEPNAEATVLQGSDVTIRVSKGIEPVEVPGVVGTQEADAVARLKTLGFEVVTREKYSDEVPAAGTVIAQNPRAEVTVDKGSTVKLVVSRGPVTFGIDDYVGQGLEEARQALAAVGLEVRVIEQPRPRIGPFRQGSYGRVEAQSPAPGTTVRRGQTVDLYTFSAAAEVEEAD